MTGGKVRVEAAEAEAAAWRRRLSGSQVSAETLEAFFAWRQDPANDDAYRRVEAVWTGSGRLAGDPEIGAALDAALARGRGRTAFAAWRRPAAAVAAGLAALVIVTWGGWTYVQSRSVFETRIGEQELVTLSDGTSVRLDTASRLRVRYTGDRRSVVLEAGRARFDVAHAPDRPFVVLAGETAVTAVGTVFDVRRDGPVVRVVLVSGAVDVARRSAAGTVRPGERLSAGQTARVGPGGLETAAVDLSAESGWTEGRIVFSDTPLTTALAEVNRYVEAPVVLDPSVRAQPDVTGVFRAGDREAFVAAVEAGFGLRARTRDDGVVVLSSP